MWPEITGYRGHAEQPSANTPVAELPPFFEVVALLESPSHKTEFELPEAETAVLAKRPISPSPGHGGREGNASRAVSGPESFGGVAAAQRSGAARTILLVVVVLIIVALIAGAAL